MQRHPVQITGIDEQQATGALAAALLLEEDDLIYDIDGLPLTNERQLLDVVDHLMGSKGAHLSSLEGMSFFVSLYRGRAQSQRYVFHVEPEQLRAVIAAQIRARAKAKNLSLVALAKAANVTQSHVYAVVAGEKSPTADWLAKIAAVLGCPPHELLRPMRGKGGR